LGLLANEGPEKVVSHGLVGVHGTPACSSV